MLLAGFDFGKIVYDVTKKAEGAAGGAAGLPLALGMQGSPHQFAATCISCEKKLLTCLQGLGMGMGMVQSIVSAVLDVVPPLIPPPVWNNMPLPCAPMVTGAFVVFLIGICQHAC